MNAETELACTGPAGSVPGPSPGINYGYEFSVLMGFLSIRVCGSLILVLFLGPLFLLFVGFPNQMY